MDEEINQDEAAEFVEEFVAGPPEDDDGDDVRKAKNRKRNVSILKQFYGADWDGSCDKISDLADMIPMFKDYYFTRKRQDMKTAASKIIVDFNRMNGSSDGRCHFYPWPNQYRIWRKKWDKQLMLELGYEEEKLREARRIKNVVAVRDENRALIPAEDELENGVRTLGGMLLNDAVDMLQRDNELDEVYTSDELIKRKSYVMNVFAHVTRNVQGKEALKLKKRTEDRETTGFLMGIMNRAIAGKISPEEMDLLKTTATVHAEGTPSQPA